MRIIPAIDIIDGQCVRLTKGDYAQKKVYSDDPVAVARTFEDHGIQHLHVVDLDGAKSKHIVNIEILRKITSSTNLFVDFGGGVKSDDDIQKAFEAGASMITGGSIAIRDPEIFSQWLSQYGPERIILGADTKGRQIAVGGWLETSDVDIFQFIEHYRKKSVKFVICTDIERDGVLQGPAMSLYAELIAEFPEINFIASGGVGSITDVEAVAKTGVWGVIIGKAIYEGRIQLKDLQNFLD
jgi:phosphoribosylformimino-5-aminoimidazole carboxamide ribotide isomerase